jgi:DNA invertase Pin-like site-specific DNA recombinase
MKTNDAATLTHPLITAEHLRRKAIVYVRQSSMEQVERNTGSQIYQRSQLDLARAYGWADDLVEVIDDDLGKSGSSVDRRTGWHSMLEQVAANRIAIIFAANISRLGREYMALEKLRLLAQYHGTLLCLAE